MAPSPPLLQHQRNPLLDEDIESHNVPAGLPTTVYLPAGKSQSERKYRPRR